MQISVNSFHEQADANLSMTYGIAKIVLNGNTEWLVSSIDIYYRRHALKSRSMLRAALTF